MKTNLFFATIMVLFVNIPCLMNGVPVTDPSHRHKRIVAPRGIRRVFRPAIPRGQWEDIVLDPIQTFIRYAETKGGHALNNFIFEWFYKFKALKEEFGEQRVTDFLRHLGVPGEFLKMANSDDLASDGLASELLEYQDAQGKTALHHAVETNNVRAVLGLKCAHEHMEDVYDNHRRAPMDLLGDIGEIKSDGTSKFVERWMIFMILSGARLPGVIFGENFCWDLDNENKYLTELGKMVRLQAMGEADSQTHNSQRTATHEEEHTPLHAAFAAHLTGARTNLQANRFATAPQAAGAAAPFTQTSDAAVQANIESPLHTAAQAMPELTRSNLQESEETCGGFCKQLLRDLVFCWLIIYSAQSMGFIKILK